ncbi:MAG: transglycosylase domain-containing protein, partial [Jiangellaceae bacterium]
EELRMAVAIEQRFSKDEVLERYLNIAFFGSRAYGIEAAARTYFSTSAAELTLPQAAMIAGLVQAPTDYDPTRNPEAALSRRNVVLSRMAETGRISEADAAEVRATDLGLVLSPASNGCVDAWAGYFCDYVFNEIMTMEELGATPQERRDVLYRGGVTITTTLDKTTQQAAQAAISDRVAATDSAIASTASVEPGTGYIKAMANSRVYGVEGAGVSQINYAVDELMGGGNGIQPGSSFKPFVLAAAINQGIGLNTSIRAPQTISISQNRFTTCKGRYPVSAPYTVKNSTGSGTFNLKTGTERSVNTFYVQLLQRTGICEPATIAKAAGISRAYLDSEGHVQDLAQVPSFALGSNEVSPLSMAGAYAMFANRGLHCDAKAVLTVTDSSGTVLVDRTEPTCNKVLEPPVADTVNSVLQGVIHNPGGTGGRMKLDDGRIAAGKTGTTNNAVAVWFVGYVPQLSTAVAVADVDGTQETLDGRTYNGERIRQACGGCIPGPIWQEIMNDALEGQSKEKFVAPDPKTIRGLTVSVPDVRGMGSGSAIARLEEAGFSASVAGEVASDLAQGLVVDSDPGAGADVGSGSYVGLYVSTGQAPAPPPPPENNGNGGGNGGGDGRDGGDGELTIELPVLPDLPDLPGSPGT